MPVSLVDYTSLIKDPFTLGLFKNFYRLSDVLKLFPVTDVGSLVVRGERWNTLPTHAFRKLNDTFSDSTGTTSPVEDRLAIYGGEFKVDNAYEELNDPVLRDPVQLQFDMHNKAMERGMMDNIVNGSIQTDPDSFDGFFRRFDSGDFPASQVISASGTTDSLKVQASEANARQFFEKFDEALYEAGLRAAPQEGTAPGVALMNKATFLGIQKAAVMANLSIYVKDLLGYTWRTYRGIPFIDVGLQRDRSTEIIGNAYDPGDDGNDSSRIIVVRFAEPDGEIESPGSDGLTLVQAGTYKTLGPESYNTYEKWTLQWIVGMAHVGDDYCAALLDDFKMAAS
ncbi:MAG: major capsid protein [Chloroflexota bacterium]